MVRRKRGAAAILDAHAVGRSHANDENGWAARLVQHRVECLEPVLARHGGRLVMLPGDGARAEFPSAAAALGAAIEYRQAMADANRGQPENAAVVFRLRLRDASEGDVAQQSRQQKPAGGIVVSARVRDAVVGRVPASFAELGSSGLGTVERPVHAYEVGWDPADWPAASAATATPFAGDDGKRLGRWVGAIAWGMMLLGGSYLAVAPRPQPAPVGWRVASEAYEPVRLESGAGAAIARSVREAGEPEEIVGEPANADNAGPVDAHDGSYVGMATTRADGRVVTFRLKVTNGIGSGTLIQRECGTTPIALEVSPAGNVSGLVLMFGSTCLKTELAIRGRAVGGTLQLRVGSQYLELSRP